MTILAGIDEAGYGPLLGPLVVSAVALDVPDSCLSSNLWKLLSRAVARQKKSLRGRLQVNDSKKVYTPKTGIQALRRTVLGALAAADNAPTPATAGLFLSRLCPDCAHRLGDYPWHIGLDQRPLECPADVPIAADLLRRTMSARDMKILLLQSRCLDVTYFNRRISAVKNKSRVLFSEVCCLVDAVMKIPAPPDGPVHIVIDQQGGRTDYRPELQRMFPSMDLAEIKRKGKISSYELTGSGRILRLHFVARADAGCLPVALASMISKFIRELLMEQFNEYFMDRFGMKSTAGYWKDGRRFIDDLSARFPDSLKNTDRLIRLR